MKPSVPTFLAMLAGALFLWPAVVNGCPLPFNDTGGLLATALEPAMGLDKPRACGPFLLLLHGRTTLWPAAVGQALLLSHVLWLADGFPTVLRDNQGESRIASSRNASEPLGLECSHGIMAWFLHRHA